LLQIQHLIVAFARRAAAAPFVTPVADVCADYWGKTPSRQRGWTATDHPHQDRLRPPICGGRAGWGKGDRVIRASLLCTAGGALTALMAAGSAAAATSNMHDQGNPPSAISMPAAVPADFRLGTEMVVHDWVLCVSASSAEAIAKARAEGVDQAVAVYDGLKAAKSCGQFPELHVILRKPVYRSDPSLNTDARVFAASVNIGGSWPSGFVVFGGLPAAQ